MTTLFHFGRYWLWGGLAFGGGLLISLVAALPIPDLSPMFTHLRALDTLLMMGGLHPVYVPLLLVVGVGILTLGTLALLTPLALGFLVLDIHLELREVCDLQGQTRTERHLFCKLHRPAKMKGDDAPTRFLSVGR